MPPDVPEVSELPVEGTAPYAMYPVVAVVTASCAEAVPPASAPALDAAKDCELAAEFEPTLSAIAV